MLNKNSVWKVLLAVLIVAMCALYALPNLYGEDNAVQISAGRNATVTESMVSQVRDTLDSNEIDTKRIEFEDGQILVRLKDSEAQLKARESLERA